MDKFTLKDLQNKIEKRISDYIEFDVRELFDVSDYITIYGGAVRDSLAGMEIHDVDILCMPNSASKLRNFLEEKYNYKPLDLFDQDTLNMYHGISLIAEPWTLMNDNKKIIQIIRPRWKGQIKKTSTCESEYQEAYYNLIKNVDLSCCGVFLENCKREIKLKEACKNAIIHCLSKRYEVNHWSQLYNNNRTMRRESKLMMRGWKDINSDDIYFTNGANNYKKRNERLVKIVSLNFEPEEEYRVWEEQNLQKNPLYFLEDL